MQIHIPAGDCRVAVDAAKKAAEGRAAEDRQILWDRSFEALKGGAIHNGVTVDAAREKEMREMTDRDVAHVMEKHPSVERLEILLLYQQMLDRNDSCTVVLDVQDFYLLKDHLPKPE